MPKGKIAIFECTTGGHNKFYTLIDRGDGWITVNYGRRGQWHKTISKPITAWRDTSEARVKRGYKVVLLDDNYIDYDKYLVLQERLLKFRDFTITSKPLTEEVYHLGYELARNGKLTAEELMRANELYKHLKSENTPF